MHPKLVEKPVPLNSPKHQLEKGDDNQNVDHVEIGTYLSQKKVKTRSSKSVKQLSGDSTSKVASQTQKGSGRCILM